MPVARHPSVLAAVYQEGLRRILSENMPSEIIPANRPLYRAIDLPYLRIRADAPGRTAKLPGTRRADSHGRWMRSAGSSCCRYERAVHVADLAPHNPGARSFVAQIGEARQVSLAMRQARAPQTPLWQQLFDSRG